MNPPKPLVEVSGADMCPPPLSDSTLVIIDAQNEYFGGKLTLPGVKPAVDVLARLLAKAREAGTPIVHVRTKGEPGRLFDLEARGGAIIDAVKPIRGESVVTKVWPNAFTQSELDATLKRLGRSQLVIAGFIMHMAVRATARAALDLGYKVTIVADVAATPELPNLENDVIDVDALRAVVAELAGRFAIVASVDQIPAK